MKGDIIMANEKALLVISFGTTYPDTCKKTIEAIEKDLAAAFPNREFYRAWTSSIIRKKLKERDGLTIFSPTEALDKMLADGVKDVLIQTTHMLAGGEFDKVTNALLSKAGYFEKVKVGRPLMENEDDVRAFVKTLEVISGEPEEGKMSVFMGHGSSETQFPVYELINQLCRESGRADICVGTVEFEPGVEPVLERVKERAPKNVTLAPLLIVAGDHANNDMAGDEEDSWKNLIRKEGPEVTCVIKGLGEYDVVRAMYVDHARNAE